MRKKLATLAVALAATLSSVVVTAPAHAAKPYGGNIYNNSDHGMWMVRHWPAGMTKRSYAGLITNDIFWVPAKTWSSAGGWPDTDGFFSGGGWCVIVYQSHNGGWARWLTWKGPVTVRLEDNPEWLIEEKPC